jgi:hypothetical protein
VSLYGDWSKRDGLPVFTYRADQDSLPEAEWDPIQLPRTRRHWVMLGNRGIQMQVANDGRVALFDERYAQRWLFAPDPAGTGVSIVEAEGERWGSAWDARPAGSVPERSFGPTWFEVAASRADLSLVRTLLCPEGEMPWVLVRVHLANGGSHPLQVLHIEEWAVAPRFLNVLASADSRRQHAREAVAFDVESSERGLVAVERRLEGAEALSVARFPQVFGPTVDLMLEALGETRAAPEHDGEAHPVLRLKSELSLAAGESADLWFRVGARDGTRVEDPAALAAESAAALHARLPAATAERFPEATREIPWHAALLTGGLSRDEVIGGHTLNQSSAYVFAVGFNGAARDPLQHAIPLIYSEPALALSVLRNTSAWSDPGGELPYALDGAKQPASLSFQPSDQSLWALALAAEYAAATGDVVAFGESLDYHPSHAAPAASLAENLRRQFRFFVDGVGLGEHGHVRMRNADWNDAAIALSGVGRAVMIESGESVLNSAMAAWVLPRYAGLCERLGDAETAEEARRLGEQLRRAVAGEWNGRWFRRAYAPGKGALGDEDCWLEVQPWALLCGAPSDDQARTLLEQIDKHLRSDSPLGARVRWPAPPAGDVMGSQGEGTAGGVWFSINMTLVWAAARLDPDLAWDEWRRMTLSAHAAAYPGIWTGTLSGPDAYNGVESPRAGETWGTAMLAMQAYPVNNLHSHSQPLLSYLRLLGVEPLADGRLQIRGGAAFSSATLRIDADGHGSLETRGPVVLDTPFGAVRGGPGKVAW